MRLLSVVATYWPAFQFGGPIPAIHSLHKALARRGVDVTVYTTNAGLGGKVPVNREVSLDGIGVFYFTINQLFEGLGGTGWQLSMPLSRALKQNVRRFDIVHVWGIWNYPSAVASHYVRMFHVPYFISPLGSLYPDCIRRKGWKKWPYYAFISRRDIRRAAAIHYLTTNEREGCHALYGLANRAVVLPNGVEALELPERNNLIRRYPLLEGKTIVLFLGRIHEIKGLDILAKAFARVARERSDVALLIVGPDERGYEETVRGLLRRENVSDNVVFTGLLQGDEKFEALAGSDVFVLPSYSEGFSMAILEGMACGLPVLITHQCHFPEVADAGAGYVVGPNAQEVAKALRDLVDDPALRSRMGENGRRLVKEKYTWDRIAAQMIEEYKKVLGNWHPGDRGASCDE
jgi:glycosyltransferase involved in cell wall biosynthesis